jgi:hypothetical protein
MHIHSFKCKCSFITYENRVQRLSYIEILTCHSQCIFLSVCLQHIFWYNYMDVDQTTFYVLAVAFFNFYLGC